jgi:hypothetical protein
MELHLSLLARQNRLKRGFMFSRIEAAEVIEALRKKLQWSTAKVEGWTARQMRTSQWYNRHALSNKVHPDSCDGGFGRIMARYPRADLSFLEMAIIGYEAEKQRIAAAIADIQAKLGTGSSASAQSTPKKHTMSAAARKRIAAAQRARWAAVKKAKAEPEKPKRKLSAAGRKAIIEATRKRWAAVRKAAAKGKK